MAGRTKTSGVAEPRRGRTGGRSALAALAALALAGCAGSAAPPASPAPGDAPGERGEAGRVEVPDSARLADLRRGTPHGAWRSAYAPAPAPPTLIRGAVVMTAAGEEIQGGAILLEEGRIAAIGEGLEAPPEARVVEAAGRYVTPGLIDSHSHIGVSATPEVAAHYDNNEVGTTTPELWIEHSVWPQGPGFARARAAGVTTAQLLPGSGDLIEGRGVTVKLVPARTVREMVVPGAPWGLKMACGENPKGRGFPSTRMGNVAGYRRAFIRGQAYRDRWDAWLAEPTGDPPDRDLGLETLAEALRGHILLQVHCYRADDMAAILELADEFGLRVRSFHHAVEAYKIRDRLADRGVAASMWADWWGFKMEALDGIPENVALVSAAGAPAVVHSDSDLGIQLLNQEAAKAMWAGRRAGLNVSRDEALRWITANPARALGIGDRTGTLEVGKDADVVLWSGDPLGVYARAERVWIDGVPVYDRTDADRRPIGDFEAGLAPPGGREAPGVPGAERAGGAGSAEPDTAVQLVSPLGRELRALPDTGEAGAALSAARRAAAAHPDSAETLLALGSAQAALWRYREAVDTYSRGIRRWPGDARFHRHRGHRHISLRRFDEALRDLERAAELDPEDAELRFDVFYHLGLARYLRGDWAAASEAYERAWRAAGDDDGRVAAAYWRWLALSREGRGEAARELASRIDPGMAVEENVEYHRLLLLFAGIEAREALLAEADADPLRAATLRYGIGAHDEISGRRARAREVFREIVRGPYWPAFGFIAAEAELARRP